jgi:hypothetical protein
MLCDEEYVRLRAAFLAMAKRSDLPHEQTRWLALGRACQELLTTDLRSKTNLGAHWQRAAEA